MSVVGTWAPLPGRIVDLAATEDMLFLADVPESGQPMRVHAGRWRAGRWRWEGEWTVARPPTVGPDHDLAGTSASLDVDAGPAGVTHVALNRIEYQGGSHGIALATFANGTWSAREEIESPTDSDIAFGTPALRRGAEVLTCEQDDHLWHYTRERTRWRGRAIAMPGADTNLSGPMAVDPSGRELVVAYSDAAGVPALARYRLNEADGDTLIEARTMPGLVNALAFGGSTLWRGPDGPLKLYVGFVRPAADGSIVWALGPDLVATRRFELPAPADPKLEHLSELHASTDWILALQIDGAWVLDAAGSSPARRLELPNTGAGKSRWPKGAMMGSVAVVLVEGRLGAFELA